VYLHYVFLFRGVKRLSGSERITSYLRYLLDLQPRAVGASKNEFVLVFIAFLVVSTQLSTSTRSLLLLVGPTC
jgi:hypothetical protein